MNNQNRITVVSALLFAALTACGPRESQVQENTRSIVQKDSTAKIIIVDVRTPEEYSGDGHADCTVNYPLDEFVQHIEELKDYDKVILVCRSGNRAGRALNMLVEAGYSKAENAGAWQDAPCVH
jgi:rhodanese-related sulfurtransferase